MKIKYLRLNDFRNYKSCRLAVETRLNVFLGQNAQGKTNLLEALYFLATARSPRTNSAGDMVKWERAEAGISAQLEGLAGTNEVGFVIGKDGRKKPYLNRKLQRRVSQLVGVLKAVFFMPDDLALIKGGPSERRSFLDAGLSQLTGAYLSRLSRYQRVVKQRNELLKKSTSGQVAPDEFRAWDEQLAEFGSLLTVARWQAVLSLARHAANAVKRISGECLEVRYRSSFLGELGPEDGSRLEELKSQAVRELARLLPADCRRGYTSLGPHADDLAVYLAGKELRSFGSQGQQRTAVVALKIAMCEYFHEVSGEYPLLLLDDVASELDERRRDYLLDCLDGGAQVFLTATEELSGNIRLKGASYYSVKDGRIEKLSPGL